MSQRRVSDFASCALGVVVVLLRVGWFAWFPLRAQVPRMLIEHKHHKKTWKRKEIGIRLPDAPVLLDLLQQLDG